MSGIRKRGSALPAPPQVCSSPLILPRASSNNPSETIYTSEYVFATSRGSLAPPSDHGIVAVVDGTTLKLTPFRTANVPPPMAMFEVQVATNIIDVSFSAVRAVMIILHQSGVDLFKWNYKGDRSILPTRLATLSHPQGFILPQQLSVAALDTLTVLVSDGDTMAFRSYAIDSSSLVALRDAPPDLPPIIGISSSGTSTLVGIAQGTDGQLFSFSSDSLESLYIKFPVACPLFEVAQVEDSPIAFGLSRNGHLFANSRLLVKNCTSFLVTQSHLVFTTNNHLVKFVHLTEPTGKPINVV